MPVMMSRAWMSPVADTSPRVGLLDMISSWVGCCPGLSVEPLDRAQDLSFGCAQDLLQRPGRFYIWPGGWQGRTRPGPDRAVFRLRPAGRRNATALPTG